MRTAALLLMAGLLGAPVRAGTVDGAAVWDRVVGLYSPGGPLSVRLQADSEDKRAPAFLEKLLNDPVLTPMGPDEGARWFRERLKELRGRKPARREGLVGWVVEKSAGLEWRAVQTGTLEAR